MTTTMTEREPRERVSDPSVSEGNEEHSFQPLLLAALLARRENQGDGMSPLLLAMLARRREDQGDEIAPLLLAALMQRREQRNGADKIVPRSRDRG